MHFNTLASKADNKMEKHTKDMKSDADKLEAYAENSLKSGRTVTSIPREVVKEYADKFRGHADKAMDIMKDNTKAVRTEADDLANTMQGSEVLYANDRGTPDPGQQEGGKRMLGNPARHYNVKAFNSTKSTPEQIREIKSMATSPQEQYSFEQEYERVLQTKGETQAENFVGCTMQGS